MMTEQATNSEPALRRERLEVLIVRAGERWLGTLAEEATGVERGREPTPLPHAPDAVLGVVSVRGRILTLLDPLALMGERRAERTDNARPAFILALRGQEQLALAVESAEQLREIFSDEIAQPIGAEARIARGAFQDAGRRVILLDVTRLFAAAVEGMEPRRHQRILTDER
ncbi:MAG TPA: chemotaxis protein CheW [Pyrinomonadaceae bacterium]|jgi:chemotaxis signal transduction protein